MQAGKATPNEYSSDYYPGNVKLPRASRLDGSGSGYYTSQSFENPGDGDGTPAGDRVNPPPGSGVPGGPANPITAPQIPSIDQNTRINLPKFPGFPAYPEINFPSKTPEEIAMFAQFTKLAAQLGKQGGQYFETAFPAYQNALRYFDIMAGMKGKALLQETIAPTVADINERYKGAASSLDNLRGAAREEALAELNRSRVSDQARVATGVQPQAAAQLGQMALAGTEQGLQAQQAGAALTGEASKMTQQDRQFTSQLMASVAANQASYAAEAGRTEAQYWETELQVNAQLLQTIIGANTQIATFNAGAIMQTDQFNRTMAQREYENKLNYRMQDQLLLQQQRAATPGSGPSGTSIGGVLGGGVGTALGTSIGATFGAGLGTAILPVAGTAVGAGLGWLLGNLGGKIGGGNRSRYRGRPVGGAVGHV